MKIVRPHRPPAPISLVSMIDVLMIMLIFFMVTSTYLDLSMMPMAERGDDAVPEVSASATTPGATVLIRLGADGHANLRGQQVDNDRLVELLRARLVVDPATSVIVLPSGMAETQALVGLLDAATEAGVTQLRVLRLEARP